MSSDVGVCIVNVCLSSKELITRCQNI